jgi:hypothetical protein
MAKMEQSRRDAFSAGSVGRQARTPLLRANTYSYLLRGGRYSFAEAQLVAGVSERRI